MATGPFLYTLKTLENLCFYVLGSKKDTSDMKWVNDL